MQTLLAHALTSSATSAGSSGEHVAAGLARVEQWYASLWGAEAVRRDATADGGGVGLHLWDRADEECRWPSWHDDEDRAAATLHVPLGYERVIGDVDPAAAPLALLAHLDEVPADVLELTGPFVLAALDRAAGRLTLRTDGLGVGRLYELRTPQGRVWSNRPVAALLFAGVRAEADPLAWRRMAALDWPMGEATPYAGVRTVPAAATVTAHGGEHAETADDVLRHLTDSPVDPLDPERIAATADALVATARSMQRLWPQRPVLTLSGGRDSRLVAAAFLAAGADLSFTTYGGIEGEVDTARRLVAALPREIEHKVTTPSAQKPAPGRGGALERARRWHDTTEGLRPALYVRNLAPKALLRNRPPLVSGAGGELAHGHFYPNDIERVEALPHDRRAETYVSALLARLVLPRGLAPSAVAAVDEQVRAVLTHAAVRGVTDATALDWFYADERLRRWGMAGESYGKVLPLLSPAFVRSAFGLSTAQSRESALHRALIAQLVPEWADVPFFSANLRQRQAVKQQRLWEEPDRDLLTAVFAEPSSWRDAFAVREVQVLWRRACAGEAAARDELLLQRVVWRAAFDDHLAAVNGEPAPARQPAPLTALPRPPRDVMKAARSLAARANDVPMARRLARTSLGRRLRRKLGV